MKLPRFLSWPVVFVAPTVPDGSAYCHDCGGWRGFDTIPADLVHGIPEFVICRWCGGWLDMGQAS